MELTLLEFKYDCRDVSVIRESKKEVKTFFERRVVARKFLAIRPSALTIAKKPRLSPKSALVMEATLIHLANVLTDWSQLVAVKMVTEKSKMLSMNWNWNCNPQSNSDKISHELGLGLPSTG